MAVSRLARLAAAAPVPVFAALGAGARGPVEELTLSDDVTLVDSPRHATVLLVAGAVPRSLIRPLSQVHDQLAHPRATAWWSSEEATLDPLPQATLIRAESDVVLAVRGLHAALLRGERASELDVLPDEPANPWRGLGANGQGGEGMMGGTPYGRPMAMTGEDRDGLPLDQLHLRLGPFLPAFPPGLVLDTVIQGDVLQECAVVGNPFERDELLGGALTATPPDPERTLAAMERARARHHLHRVARTLRLHGLDALARRMLALAMAPPDDGDRVRYLAHRLERSTALRWATEGVGRIDPSAAEAVGGIVARAAGWSSDARSDDPVYAELGFTPIFRHGSDAQARWRQRLAEAAQALDLAAAAGERRSDGAALELPWGDDDADRRLLDLLPGLLTGQELGDAMTTLDSLDLDLERVARAVARTERA